MSDENASNRGGFNTWWFVSAGFILLIIVALIIVLVVGHNRGNGNPGGAASAPTSTGSGRGSTQPSSGGGGTDGACDLPSKNQDLPVSGPSATWKSDGYFKYPTSTTYGPVATDDLPGWACFAHSPTGALFAAANVFDGLAGTKYASVAKAAGVDNSARSEWISAQDPAQHTQSAGGVAQISGYQFTSVKPDAAVIRLEFSQADVNAFETFSLAWDASAGTWKLDFSTSTIDSAEQVQNANAFTPWAAVS